jgi:hypothetical protein
MRLKVFKINQYILSMCADSFFIFWLPGYGGKIEVKYVACFYETLSNSEGP